MTLARISSTPATYRMRTRRVQETRREAELARLSGAMVRVTDERDVDTPGPTDATMSLPIVSLALIGDVRLVSRVCSVTRMAATPGSAARQLGNAHTSAGSMSTP